MSSGYLDTLRIIHKSKEIADLYSRDIKKAEPFLTQPFYGDGEEVY
jgi:hypothetical protein